MASCDIALRLGFCWRRTTRGFISKAREETKRAFKHAKRDQRYGFEPIKRQGACR